MYISKNGIIRHSIEWAKDNDCPGCGSKHRIDFNESKTHFARLRCQGDNCDYYSQKTVWVPKPIKETNAKRNVPTKKLRKVTGDKDYCEICFAKKGEIHPTTIAPVELQIHHKLPFCEYPELESDPDNLLTVCKPCHADIGEAQRRIKNYKKLCEDPIHKKVNGL